MAIKELLNAFHDAVKWALHVCLIPVVALLKGVTAISTHVTTELERV